MSDHAFFIRCSDAAHEIAIHIVIQGQNRRIEENEVALIKLSYGVGIKPEKEIIARFYREKNTSITELIKQATKKHLCKAFRDLIVSLNSIEDNC